MTGTSLIPLRRKALGTSLLPDLTKKEDFGKVIDEHDFD